MIGSPSAEIAMRLTLLAAILLVLGCGRGQRNADAPAEPEPAAVAPAVQPDEPPPLHTEKGIRHQLKVEESVARQQVLDQATKEPLKPPLIAGQYTYHRLIIGETLHGSQVRKHDRHFLDDFQCLTAANPWDNIANLGAIHAFDMREEPLTYHHRTGPVGAIYRELRTRKGGADAKAPVAVLGLTAGTQACYALKGQKMTFYETDPAVVKLVADTDKYFSYVADARKRGAEIEIRVGNRREKLKEDKDRKYAIIFVDLAESFPECTDIFTKDAVREYLDRLTDDGLIALHISNKFYRFEPMCAKIAEELNLSARVWNDDAEGRHGKTASSWMVLTRNEKTLGTLGLPQEQQQQYGTRFRMAPTDPDIPVWTDKNTTVVEGMKFKR
jgi:hypothetical protein